MWHACLAPADVAPRTIEDGVSGVWHYMSYGSGCSCERLTMRVMTRCSLAWPHR